MCVSSFARTATEEIVDELRIGNHSATGIVKNLYNFMCSLIIHFGSLFFMKVRDSLL
jgi:hypothetical protein